MVAILLVAEPQRDHGGVDAGVQQVIAAVWRSVCGVTCLVAATGSVVLRGRGVLGEAPLDRVAAERCRRARSGNSGSSGLAGAFAQPGAEHRDGLAW